MAALTESRVRFNDGQGVSARKVPIPHLLVTATTAGAAQTLFTVRPEVLFEVKRLAVANLTASAVTLNLNSVPPLGSVADGNAEAKGLSIPANTVNDLTDFIGGFYTPGTTFRAYASAGSALILHGFGEEVL